MSTEDLMKLYELAMDEEHYFIESHQDRISFYIGLISAILAAVGAGFLQASEWYHFAVLCTGPILIFMVSSNAQAGTFRLYQRFVEAVIVRAKIEQKLGLTHQPSGMADTTHLYWTSEPIISARQISSRKAYESSDAFLREQSTKGYHDISKRLFRGLQWLSILLFVGLVASAVLEAL